MTQQQQCSTASFDYSSCSNTDTNKNHDKNGNESRNTPSHKFTLTNERKEEILSNLSILSSQSTYLQEMPYEEQLQIIEEIKGQLRSEGWHYSYDEDEGVNDDDNDVKTKKVKKKINKTPFGDYEASLLQMSPLPCAGKKIVDSADVKKYKAFAKFTITYVVLAVLDSYEEILNYKLRREKQKREVGSPRLIKNVKPLFDEPASFLEKEEQLYVHGRVSLPLLLTDFEVWTKSDQRIDQVKRNEKGMKPLIVSCSFHTSLGAV